MKKMKKLKNLVKTETLNVEELLMIKGAERLAQGCSKVSCSTIACPGSACNSNACTSNACTSTSCSSATCSSAACQSGMDANIK